MTLEEFVGQDPAMIRKSDKQMQLFIDFYEAAFSFKPKCAGCAFKNGFKKLQRYAAGKDKIVTFKANKKTMAAKTFQLKKENLLKILTYKSGGKTLRKYGHALTEEFAIALVADGQSDLFVTLPKVQQVSGGRDYSAMDYQSEILPLYKEVSERLGKTADSKKKADIIEFLKENEG